MLGNAVILKINAKYRYTSPVVLGDKTHKKPTVLITMMMRRRN